MILSSGFFCLQQSLCLLCSSAFIFFILGHASNQLGINLVINYSVRLLAGLYPVISVLYTVTVLQLTATVLKYPCYRAAIIRYSNYCNPLHHSARLESLGFSSFLWRFPRHELLAHCCIFCFSADCPPLASLQTEGSQLAESKVCLT